MKECVYASNKINYIKRRHRAYLWMFRAIPSVDIDNETGTVTIMWCKYAFGKVFIMGKEVKKFEDEEIDKPFSIFQNERDLLWNTYIRLFEENGADSIALPALNIEMKLMKKPFLGNDDLDNGSLKLALPKKVESKKPLTVEMLRKKCESIAIKPIIINGKKVYPCLFNLPITDEMQEKIDDGEVFLFNQNIFNKQKREETMKSDIGIARVCHEANRQYCIDNKLPVGPVWDEAPEDIQSSVIHGVKQVIANPKITATKMHERWCDYKAVKGWIFGKLDIKKKLHPNMVAFNKLPKAERGKDKLFIKTVKTEMKK